MRSVEAKRGHPLSDSRSISLLYLAPSPCHRNSSAAGISSALSVLSGLSALTVLPALSALSALSALPALPALSALSAISALTAAPWLGERRVCGAQPLLPPPLARVFRRFILHFLHHFSSQAVVCTRRMLCPCMKRLPNAALLACAQHVTRAHIRLRGRSPPFPPRRSS